MTPTIGRWATASTSSSYPGRTDRIHAHENVCVGQGCRRDRRAREKLVGRCHGVLRSMITASAPKAAALANARGDFRAPKRSATASCALFSGRGWRIVTKAGFSVSARAHRLRRDRLPGHLKFSSRCLRVRVPGNVCPPDAGWASTNWIAAAFNGTACRLQTASIFRTRSSTGSAASASYARPPLRRLRGCRC